MKTIEINIYSFEELEYTAKQNAITEFNDINVQYEWYEFILDDAKEVGIKIKTFDLYTKDIDIDLLYSCDDIANKIMFNHGQNCQTYIVSETFLEDRTKLVAKYSDGCNLEYVLDENIEQFDEDLDELENEYKKYIEEEYLIMLEKEYEYLTSDEAIIEKICANNYEFTEDGKLY